MAPARLLALDTSGPWCAVAVLQGCEVLGACQVSMAKGQAERLMPLISETLEQSGLGLTDMDAIGVGIGPGNFTGIRLGVAAARGLALSLARPAIGVSALEAAAEGGPRPLLALLDARRGAVYAQRFTADGSDAPKLVDDPSALPQDLPRRGDGPGAVAADTPLAERIGQIALRRLGTPQPRPAPLYIRAADAAPPRDGPPPMLP